MALTDHDPVGNEQRAVDGDLDGGIYGPCLGPTTSASRWRQGESPVSADGRAEPVRLGIAPWVDTPCLTLDRSDSVRTVGPGVFHAIIRPPPITGLPLSVSGAGCVQRSVGEDHSRWGTHLSGKVNGQAIFNRVGLGRPVRPK